MAIQSSLRLLALLPFVPLALANYAYPSITAGVVYENGNWDPACFDNAAECYDGCFSMFNFASEASSFTYSFPFASTTWEWWGYQMTGAGLAQVCFDGATGSACDTVSYFNADTIVGLSPAALLYTKTGLSNAKHVVTVTNIPDTNNGGQYGSLNADHFEIAGGPAPTFPSDTTIVSIPTVDNNFGSGMYYWVDMTAGDSANPQHSTFGSSKLWASC